MDIQSKNMNVVDEIQLPKDKDVEIHCVSVDPDAKYIACGTTAGEVPIICPNTKKVLFTLNVREEDEYCYVSHIIWRPISTKIKAKNVLCTIDSEGRLKHWHVTSSKCLHTLKFTDGRHASCMDFTQDGSKFVLGSEKEELGYTVSVFDESNKVEVIRTDVNELKIRSIRYKKNSDDIFYFGGWDSNLYVYDVRVGAIVQKWDGVPTVESDTIDNNGSYICVGGLNKFRIFDERMRSAEYTFDMNDDSRIYACKFIPETNYVAIGGANTMQMKIFDVKDKNLSKKPYGITTTSSDVYCFDFYKDKRDSDKDNIVCRSIIGYKDGFIRSYTVNKN